MIDGHGTPAWEERAPCRGRRWDMECPPHSQSDQCCYPVCQEPATCVPQGSVGKSHLCWKRTPHGAPGSSPELTRGLSASAPRSPPVPMATHTASHSPHSSGTARACAFGFSKVPDLPNLLTPRNLLLPLGPLRTRREGCQNHLWRAHGP